MKKVEFVLSIVVLLNVAGLCQGQGDSIRRQETLTNGFWGLNDRLVDSGIEFAFGVINIYQVNTHGGTSTHNRNGRYSGSYDLEFSADLQRLLGMENGRFYMRTEGSWAKSGGIDASAVGSAFGVNGDSAARRSMDVTEWWLGLFFADETIYLTIGKLNLSGGVGDFSNPISFDNSAYASDVTTLFLNNALSNNPTIPFPYNGLAIAVSYNPTDFWYISAAVADAQADSRETGFRTTFYDEDYFFYIFEAGITPELDSANGSLPGACRVGLWNDPQPKKNKDSSKYYRDDVGVYTSCDQMLYKENFAPQDSQGLGAFFRYGYAPSRRNDITNFFSLGFQYQGLADGRDDDILGVGYAHGFFANTAASSYAEDYESALEVYYSAQITPWFNLSPSVQYVANPGGSNSAKDATVFAIRAQMTF